MSAVLVEVSPNPGMRYSPGVEAVIGREDCDIELGGGKVSRRHAAIRTVAQRVEIEDLGSRNGTFVNDRRITGPQRLRAGDQIRIGETVLELQEAEVAARGARDGARGDVPAPEAVPTVVREAPPLEAVGPPAFERARRRRGGPSAATIGWATAISVGIIATTAVAVVLYLVLR